MERAFDTASLIRLRHDTLDFRAIIDTLNQCPEEDSLPEKNHCIYSVEYDEFSSDYCSNDAFSCGW